MPPKPDELPKLEDWKAPWEVKKDGETVVEIPEDEQVIDKTKLKKYLHGLLGDKNRLRKTADDATAQVDELQQKLATAKTPEELKALQDENARLLKERDDAKEKAKGSADALKWEIALDKGLTKTMAKRLVGTTREELEADADALLKEFGGTGKSEESGDDVRRGPRRTVTNAGDPAPNAGKEETEADPDEVVKRYLAGQR